MGELLGGFCGGACESKNDGQSNKASMSAFMVKSQHLMEELPTLNKCGTMEHMATNSRAKRKAAKRPTSVKQAEAGVKSAQDVFKQILRKADSGTESAQGKTN